RRRRGRRPRTTLSRLHVHQLDLEYESRVRTDIPAGASFAISEIRRDENLILRTWFHQLQCFRPAFDDAIHRKSRRLPAFIGTVELGAIDKSPTVIYHHCVGLFRGRTASLFQHLVLQPAGGCFYTGLIFLFAEKFFTLGLVFFTCLFVSHCCFLRHFL